MTRQYRELSNDTKQKISTAMKQYHANKTAAQEATTSQRQSAAMKRYWTTIPKKSTPYCI
ncbi:MAG: hypothetical protein IKW35_09140 [Paludibacteraceae bacterium]|nr:hypothetical protein [Paludibacteraceae bacterium]